MGFWEMDFWENDILGEWDNWVCIKSRALGVKVDQRSQSQPAGLEQGAPSLACVQIEWVFLPQGAKKMQTLLQPLASGESAIFWLLKARMPRCVPTSAAGLTFYLIICQANAF